MALARVHNFAISLDGFGTGEPQTLESPFGHAGERLHEWMFKTRFWGEDGATGVDDAYAQRNSYGIGAEIMGANKFGPPDWQDDPDWKGWWGPNPPFHSPTFVLTHRPRPPIEMEGGTTYHFLDTTPTEALETALEAAEGQDVRIGGGATGDPRLPRRRTHRPHARGRGPDHARPRLTPLGRPRRHRERLQHRSRLHTQRSHPPDLHPRRHLGLEAGSPHSGSGRLPGVLV